MDSRQVLRYNLRRESFREITKIYPGESRKIRRSMALDLSKRQYRLLKRKEQEARSGMGNK